MPLETWWAIPNDRLIERPTYYQRSRSTAKHLIPQLRFRRQAWHAISAVTTTTKLAAIADNTSPGWRAILAAVIVSTPDEAVVAVSHYCQRVRNLSAIVVSVPEILCTYT